MYGDKVATLARFKENYQTLLTDEMKARVVLENDEVPFCHHTSMRASETEPRQMCYSPDDLLPVCDELDIPMVLDYHHNWINVRSRPPHTERTD